MDDPSRIFRFAGKRVLVAIAFIVFGCVSVQGQRVRQYVLAENLIYDINVPMRFGVTAVTFPSTIESFFKANVSFARDSVDVSLNDFVVSYDRGDYKFCIRALKPDSKGYLTVFYKKKGYQLCLRSGKISFDRGSRTETDGIVNFILEKKSGSYNTEGVSPTKLISLIDQAKSYHLFEKYHPGTLEAKRVEYYKPPSLTTYRYDNFDVVLNEVIRYGVYDSIVFNISLVNKTNSPIEYIPKLTCVRTGDELYYQSSVDATGEIPAGGVSRMFFTITGTSRGGKNHLAPNNDWTVLITTRDMLDDKPDLTNAATFYQKMEEPIEKSDRSGRRGDKSPQTPLENRHESGGDSGLKQMKKSTFKRGR